MIELDLKLNYLLILWTCVFLGRIFDDSDNALRILRLLFLLGIIHSILYSEHKSVHEEIFLNHQFHNGNFGIKPFFYNYNFFIFQNL